ncbi:LPS-assembly protein LptD [Magnetospira sp. QH-2]|uniref:LPS-assembly protein LptD n=1 Tax=Magnetospira sp. (strain QH-2) TaxID=1288970 RepID=UPI0003E80E28|nr:LPS assembly protein LptD [Magnetospira sp. QH-2]CCQ74412.1 putative organic solvent tolerance protein OstA [Magnetospira sp. QH-2]
MKKVAFTALLAVLAWLPTDTRSQERESAVFTADEVVHDRDLHTITARGNVEVVYEDRTLLTDVLSYNQKDDIVTATGRVVMHEPTGEVLFARHVKLSGDLKNGIIEDLRIILQDGARLAANGGRRTDGRIMEFKRAVYSPCEICKEDPTKDPLWQVKADTASHDKDARTISYENVWLEVAGIPVAYTPYLSHPDPTVKRQSGFLIPTIGSSSDLGFIAHIPYFWAISDTADMTIEPILTTNEGGILSGQYRQRFEDGAWDMEASITRNSKDEWLGHVDSEMRFDLDSTWRAGLDVERASGETYLRRYGFNSKQTLTTRAYVEGYRKRNRASAEAFAFQQLGADDDPGTSPYVLPLLEYNHIGEADRFGGRTSLDASYLTLFRTDGRDTHRASLQGGWQLPYTGPLGDRYTLSASLRGDGYYVTNHDIPGQQDSYTGVAGRVVPQIAMDWRMPFVRQGRRVHQMIEPIGSVAISPYGGNPDEIPNEDSVDIEFDETNLFSFNRFNGLDRVEGGARFNYGLRWGIFAPTTGQATAIIGQSYRPHADSAFASNSGLEDNFSDIVASLRLSREDYLELKYRTRFDKDTLSPTRNEMDISAGIPAFQATVSYQFFEAHSNQQFATREQLQTGFSSQMSRFWSMGMTANHDLVNDNDLRSFQANLTYEDECLVFGIEYLKTVIQDRDIQPADTIMLRFNFKTLGSAEAQAY